MSSRCSPILNPKSSSSINTMTSSISSSPQIRHELSKILLQHDPNAIRLYDFINHVRIFVYNSNEYHWENNSFIEGNLFVYERKLIKDNQTLPCYAFAIINGKQKFIEQITSQMILNVDKLRLFYETVINNKCEVFCLHFVNENECLRVNLFISNAIEYLKNFEKEQLNIKITNDIPSTETNQQNLFQQQIVAQGSNSDLSQLRTINSNTESRNPALSLKRLLNIQNQNDGSIASSETPPINLIPPSAFESNQTFPLQREQIRNTLLHLVQNNEHFLDMIHNAYFNYMK